jgi:hypothetical protein
MKLKLNALALAVLVVGAAGGASAAINLPGSTSIGNGSVLFVAIDSTNNTSFIADLGLNMSDFVPGATRTTGGSSINWNFSANTSSDSTVTGNNWSGAFTTFAAAQTGGDLTWGVIAADSIAGTSVSVTNALIGRGWLATGSPDVSQMTAASTSAPTGNGLTALTNYYAAVNNFGTIAGANNGAAAVDGTNGLAYLDNSGSIAGNFNGANTWNYLVASTATSPFQYQQQIAADPNVFQIGDPQSANNALSTNPGTFAFNVSNGNLTWNVAAVPEPSNFAMLLAGLAAIGTLVRRRKV